MIWVSYALFRLRRKRAVLVRSSRFPAGENFGIAAAACGAAHTAVS